MKRTLAFTLVAVILFGVACARSAWAETESSSDGLKEMVRDEIDAYFKDQSKDFRAYWKSGLRFETRNKKFKMQVGGRIQADFSFFDDYDKNLEPATGGEWHSGFEFRRARLFVSGTIYEYVKFKAQYDFAGGDADFKDVYIGLTNLDECFGCMFPDVKVGHFKENFSLEELTSSKYITFIERSMPVGTFAPSRNSGFGLHRDFYGKRATIGVGVFGNSDDFGFHEWTDHGYHMTGRATFLPWAPCDCESRFLHLGVSCSYQGDVRSLRYRTRTDASHLGPRIVDTGTFDAESAQLVGAEVAFVYDSWHIQAEYITALVDSTAADDPTYWGGYVEGSWMFLGGTRPFKRSSATFSRVKPCKNFLGEDCCGSGGFALAARYSYVDLDDGLARGGTAQTVTLGLNWYLNPNTVVKANYVWVDVENAHGVGSPAGDGNMNVFGMRFQVDF